MKKKLNFFCVLMLQCSAQKVDLPAFISAYRLHRANPSARGGVTAPSPHRSARKLRNINRISHRHRLSAET